MATRRPCSPFSSCYRRFSCWGPHVPSVRALPAPGQKPAEAQTAKQEPAPPSPLPTASLWLPLVT